MKIPEPSGTGDTVERFVHGAKTMLVGRFLDVQSLYEKGLASVKDATHALDAASGRDPLLPLLNHEDEMVQTIAGAALWQSHTDRAKTTIEHSIVTVSPKQACSLGKSFSSMGDTTPCLRIPRMMASTTAITTGSGFSIQSLARGL